MKVIELARIVGRVILLVAAIAKQLEDKDLSKAKELLVRLLRYILPPIINQLLRNQPQTAALLSRIVNWDAALNIIAEYALTFAPTTQEVINRLKSEIEELIKKYFDWTLMSVLESAIKNALSLASVGYQEVRISSTTSLLFLWGPKGKRVILNFRW